MEHFSNDENIWSKKTEEENNHHSIIITIIIMISVIKLTGFALPIFTYNTQFEIECRCGRHSVTKKIMTILQILVAKPK